MNVRRFYRTYMCFRSTKMEYWKSNIVMVLQAIFTLFFSGLDMPDGVVSVKKRDLISIRSESGDGWIVVGILTASHDFVKLLDLVDQFYSYLSQSEFVQELPSFVKEKVVIQIDPQYPKSVREMDVTVFRTNCEELYDLTYQGRYSRLSDSNFKPSRNELKQLYQILNVTTAEEFCAVRELCGKVFEGV